MLERDRLATDIDPIKKGISLYRKWEDEHEFYFASLMMDCYVEDLIKGLFAVFCEKTAKTLEVYRKDS